ncbi:serine hydroxymethyltransferase [Candidatus Gracilibacteria bacterium]|nr:serine hydroxymethyltransferase [Candidatus Gracilibacteria bacterium]
MLKDNDKAIFDLINKEKNRQETEIELIASENYASLDVLEAAGSILTNKYSEGYPGKRYYAGQEFIDEIENLAIERCKEIFGCEYVNVQPLSGSPANLAVYMAFLKPGDKVLGMSLDQGGHLSHGHPLNFSGLLYNIIPYTLDKETGLIDMDELERIALQEKPKMIIAGFSAYSRDLDWKRFRNIADKIGAILMADIAHIAGLIAGGQLENPVPYCDVVTSTTHKTLRGPRGAIIMSKKDHEKVIARAVFPGVQGGPHENLIAAKAVAFKEALQPEFKEYAKQIIINAKTLGNELIKNGFKIISNGTDNHLLLIDVFSSFGVTGKEAEKVLELVGLSANKNMIPYDLRKAMDPSGIRIGTPAVTTRGMKEEEMKIIALIFTKAIKLLQETKGYNSEIENKSNMEIFNNNELINKLKQLKEDVLYLSNKFPVYER